MGHDKVNVYTLDSLLTSWLKFFDELQILFCFCCSCLFSESRCLLVVNTGNWTCFYPEGEDRTLCSVVVDGLTHILHIVPVTFRWETWNLYWSRLLHAWLGYMLKIGINRNKWHLQHATRSQILLKNLDVSPSKKNRIVCFISATIKFSVFCLGPAEIL